MSPSSPAGRSRRESAPDEVLPLPDLPVPGSSGSKLTERTGFRNWVARVWNGGALDDDFFRIAETLDLRTETLVHAMVQLDDAAPGMFDDRRHELFRLATVDLFVEKAQAVLTARARRMSRAGLLSSSVAVVMLGLLAWYVADNGRDRLPDLGRNELILRIVSAIGLAAIVLVAVKYLVALARSFFHESLTLLSRRHALRFGRMYLYLNPSDVQLDNLLEAFDWNRGGDSSFLDIKPGDIGQTPYTLIAQGMSDALDKLIDRHGEEGSDAASVSGRSRGSIAG